MADVVKNVKLVLNTVFKADTSQAQQSISNYGKLINKATSFDMVEFKQQMNQASAELQKVFADKGKSISFGNPAELDKIVNSLDIAGTEYSKVTSLQGEFNDAYLKMSRIENTNLIKNMENLTSATQKTTTWMDKLSSTILNTFKYQIVNRFTRELISSFGDFTSHLEEIDQKLNSIRIVTGKSNAEMKGFQKTASMTARSLGASTTAYLEASQIYFQQGLSTNEVIARTNATIKAANISGQDVVTTANQVTAVLNGFNISAGDINDTISKMAILGANTASNFEELATASQKVASAASNAGLSLDSTLAMLSTMVSVTREAPESIGTSLNSIIGRFNQITISGGEATSKIEKTFQSLTSVKGLTIFDDTGKQVKDLETVLGELVEVWDVLDQTEQRSITTALAGTRQANRLLALMNNWDTYQSNKKLAESASENADAQNEIYKQSLESIKTIATSSANTMWSQLFNENDLKGFYQILTKIYDIFAKIFKDLGGLQGVSGYLTLLTPQVSKLATQLGTNTAINYSLSRKKGEFNGEVKDTSAIEKEFQEKTGRKFEAISQKDYNNLSTSQQQLYDSYKKQAEKLLEIKQTYHEITEESNKWARVTETIDQQFGKIDPFEGKSKYAKDSRKTVNDYLWQRAGKPTNGEFKHINDIEGKEFDDILEDIDAELKQVLNEDRRAYLNKVKALIVRRQNYNPDEANDPDSAAFGSILSQKDGGVLGLLFSKENMQQMTAGLDKELRQTYQQVVDSLGTADIGNIDNNSLYKLMQALQDKAKDMGVDINKEVENAKKELENADKNFGDNKAGRSAKIGKFVGQATTAMMGVTAAINAGTNAYKVFSDSTATQSQKVTTAISGIGSVFMAIPWTRPLGMLLSAIGPVLSALGVFDSEAEKLQKKIKATDDKISSLTKNVNQQRTDLANVTTSWDKLAKKYNKVGFAVSKLTEEEKTEYDQIADYVEKYAPELIKYYDDEGNAVIDLSKDYDTLRKAKTNYLERDLLMDEYDVYSGLIDEAADNADLMIKSYNDAKKAVIDYKKQLQDLYHKQATEGKDYSEQIQNVEQALSEQQQIVSGIGQTWDKQFTKSVTKGNAAYASLSQNAKNALSGLASWNTYLKANSSLTDPQVFQDAVTNIINTYTTLSSETQKAFEKLNSTVQSAMLNLLLNLGLTSSQIREYLTEWSKDTDSFYRMDWLSKVQRQENQNYSDYLNKTFGVETTEDIEVQRQQMRELQRNTGAERSNARYNLDRFMDSSTYSEEELKAALENQSEHTKKIIDTQTGFITFQEDDVLKAAKQWEEYNKVLEETEGNLQDINDAYYGIGEGAQQASYEATAMMIDLANSSAEEYNKLVDAFYDPKTSEEAKKKIYAALRSQDKDYYKGWKEENQQTLETIKRNYGIDADNYKTLAEYKDAIDAYRAQKTQYYEDIQTMGLKEATKKRERTVLVSNMQQAKSEEEKTAYSFKLMALETSSAEAQFKLQKAAAYKKAEAEIKAQLEAGNQVIQISKDTYNELLRQEIAALNQANKSLKIAGVGDFIKSGKAEALTISAKSLSRGAAEKTMNWFKEQAEKAYKDALSYDKTLENYYNNLLDGFDDAVNDLQEPDYDPKAEIKKKKTGDDDDTPPGGAGKGSSTTSDLEFEIDLLKPYKDRIAEVEAQVSRLNAEKENLYGDKYIEALGKEINLEKEKLKTIEAELAKAKEIKDTMEGSMRDELEAVAKDLGIGDKIIYDEFTGKISNYNQLLQYLEKAYTKLKDDDAKEKWSERANDFKDAMDKYEEYADTINDIMQQQLDQINALIDLERERIEYKIKITMEASDRNKEYLDFLNSLAKSKKGNINFSVDIFTDYQKLLEAAHSARDIIRESVLEAINNTEYLKTSPEKMLELLADQESNMMGIAEELIELMNSLEESFANSLDEATSVLYDALDKLNNVYSIYNNSLSMLEKNGKDTIDIILSYADVIRASNEKTIAVLEKEQEELRKIMETTEVGSERYVAAQEKYVENTIKLQEMLTKVLEDQANTIDKVLQKQAQEFEKNLFGESIADLREGLKGLTAERDRYLTQERKIYELAKYEYQISKDIKGFQTSPAAQNKLQQFWAKELAYLKDKEHLSQSDLDLSQKQYNVLKAQIELEEAQANKKYARQLQRNSSGNYGYYYVQDTTEVDEKEQKLRDAIDELYRFSMEQYDKLNEQVLNDAETYEKEREKILRAFLNGSIDQEEADRRLATAWENLQDKLAEANSQMEIFKNNILGTTYMQEEFGDFAKGISEDFTKLIEGIMSQTTDNFGSVLESIKDASQLDNDFFDIEDNGITQLGDYWREALGSISESYDKMGTLSEDIKHFNKQMEDLINQYLDYLQQYQDKSIELVEGIGGSNGDMLNILQDYISRTQDSLNQELEASLAVIAAYEEQEKAIRELIDKYAEYIEAMQGAITQIQEEGGISDSLAEALAKSLEEIMGAYNKYSADAQANVISFANTDGARIAVPSEVNTENNTSRINTYYLTVNSTASPEEWLRAFDTLELTTVQNINGTEV